MRTARKTRRMRVEADAEENDNREEDEEDAEFQQRMRTARKTRRMLSSTVLWNGATRRKEIKGIFHVRCNLLPLLTAALSTSFKETNEQIVYLPADDANTVEHFGQWVYHKSLVSLFVLSNK